MVARIKTPNSILRALNYNEQKVKQGHAELLHAANYLKDSDKLHVSLNFDNSDKLSKEILTEIANEYMKKIGFGEQPYLVYQHYDAGHPHIHIVTTSIKEDGKRIDTFNIGRNQSEQARQELERRFGLVPAKGRKVQSYELKPINAEKIQYGKSETRRAITNVLDVVLNNYKYTSLPELNAVLQQYNLIADRGTESSRIYKNNGLVYRILDEKGNKIGVPIKSSIIYNKPGLKFLEEKFTRNETARQPDKLRIKNAIDLALLKNPNHSLESLIQALEKQGINTVLRQNAQGIIYGITYVDHRTKSVFNGSAIGKEYSAKAIQERCLKPGIIQHLDNASQQEISKKPSYQKEDTYRQISIPEKTESERVLFPNALSDLLQPEQQYAYVPYQLKKSRKKKRRQTSHRH
jgi:hypothetical protein